MKYLESRKVISIKTKFEYLLKYIFCEDQTSQYTSYWYRRWQTDDDFRFNLDVNSLLSGKIVNDIHENFLSNRKIFEIFDRNVCKTNAWLTEMNICWINTGGERNDQVQYINIWRFVLQWIHLYVMKCLAYLHTFNS